MATTRNRKSVSRPARRRKVKRSALRLDVNRASLLIGALLGALVSAFYFTFQISFRSEPVPAVEEFVFGRHSRIGSIVTVPMSGDACRQAAFNNDNGLIIPVGQISCVLVIASPDSNSKDRAGSDKFATISDKFRK